VAQNALDEDSTLIDIEIVENALGGTEKVAITGSTSRLTNL
jgi:hypothetical protein